jgi:hypothetical protein
MSANTKRRTLAAAVGLAVLVGVGVVPSVQTTEARFTDREHLSSSTFTALTLETPVITGCTTAGVVFQSATIMWTSPHPPTNMRLTVISGSTTSVVPSANISSSGPVGGVYSYSATLTQGLLASLISNLLGSTTTLSVASLVPGTSWVSGEATRKLTIGLFGLGATCTA